MSLISKLSEKLKHFAETVRKSKIVKSGLAFAMGLTIAVGATACRPATNPNTPNDPDHTITGPTDNGNGGNNTDPTDPYSQYSQILQNVLKKSYYNDLLESHKKDFVLDQSVQNIPYRFLEENGYDVAAYKNETLKCECMAYVKNENKNKLYLSVKAETQHSPDNYYANYLLSYNLTDKEYDELYMLHKGSYIQSGFFIQELDNLQDAKVESFTKIDVETYNVLLQDIKDDIDMLNILGNSEATFDLLDYDEESLSIKIYPNPYKIISTPRARILKLKPARNAGFKYSDIFTAKYINRSTPLNLDEFKTTYEDLTSFNTTNYYRLSNYSDHI